MLRSEVILLADGHYFLADIGHVLPRLERIQDVCEAGFELTFNKRLLPAIEFCLLGVNEEGEIVQSVLQLVLRFMESPTAAMLAV